MTSRFDPADPEVAARRREAPADLGPLFDQPWPERPPVGDAEQLVAPLDGTLAGKYAAWRRSPDGEAVFRRFAKLALEEVAVGATHLRAKRLWEDVRDDLQVPMNNSFHAPLVRDVEAAYPVLRGVFEKRQRTAI